MDHLRFDHLTRAVSSVLSRRTLAGALGLSALSVPALADAKKKKRKKKKKAKFNDFGCVNVGGFCKNNGQCCSGICQGKKGKKKCKAHDVDVCQVGQDSCNVEVPCTIPSGVDAGFCFTTTGNAPYCGAGGGECFDCKKDTDCLAFCGAGAACVQCPSCLVDTEFETACIGHDQACTIP